MIRFLLVILLCIGTFTGFAQTGGTNIYDFLTITNSARVAALGGKVVASPSDDVNLAFFNPALLTEKQNGSISLSYVDYLADISIGYATYGFSIEDWGNFAVGMHYINYGKFQEANPDGTLTGATFNPAEYALNIIWSKQLNENLHVGANIKPIFSSLENYKSFGMAMDAGVSYVSNSELFNAGFTIKNVGSQITSYYDDAPTEKLPFDVQLGISQKLKHAPFRYYVTLHHLHKWDLGDTKTKKSSFGEQFTRHLNLGLELVLSPNFSIRTGYNFLRKEELKIKEKTSTVGLSWGFGFKVSRFRIDYGSARYHLAGTTNFFTITTSVDELMGRKKRRYRRR
ncbi:type IX secretion system protein PorQ [Prolixibacteraceae bacterium JC049]|nr:type IX secretion system protein PorQ [Prolixibacteraceae bacterium JC049]